MVIADLHIHSRYSRATSREGDAPHLDLWARRKGIGLLGTGDFTHPAWRAELKEQLVPAGEGVYTLREDLRLPGAMPGDAPRFVVTGEISSIYKRDGKTRKVHNLILLPSLEAADELSARLEAIGNIRSDGRPILGLDSRDLLELTLETCPDAEFIPAHIWTPHFSMFGAFSGFETVEACFDDLAPHIHAVETGLSSDPPMNWRVSALDGLTLVSNSDAHSPSKLGREANLLEHARTYPELMRAIRTGEGFLGTVEFFPEEGKYHLDGHRNCGVCLTPAETLARGGLCPVCGKKLTIGVEHRVEELADRPEDYRPAGAKPFESLAPLPEAVAASTGGAAAGKKTAEQVERLLRELGPEFYILRQAPISDIERVAGPCVAEGIRRLRLGQVERRAGFDGEYGTISLLMPAEIEQMSGQISLFGVETTKKPQKPGKERGKAASDPEKQQEKPLAEALNPAQQAAVTAEERTVAVVAGPGTGKTKTLVARIAYLVETRGVKPSEITAVTFTNQAAAEMRQRLEKRLGGKRAVSRMTIGTFHAICLDLLKGARLIGPGEALTVAAETLRETGGKGSAKGLLQAVSRVKNGASLEAAGLDNARYEAYCARLRALGMLDFDDLLSEALKLDPTGRKQFTHLLVDEFQDINNTQYELVRAWSRGGKSLFAIGDPDQSIYGFRGASARCFARLSEDKPDTRVIRLTENYRSTPEIVEAAGKVIEKNPGGGRELHADRPSGAAVRLIRAADGFTEAVFVAKEIGRMVGGVDMLEAQKLGHERQTRAFADIAVLCRTHRQLELIEKCLRHDDIPCIISGREDFLDDDSVRGALAFWRSLETPGDGAALETALRLLWDCPADLIEKAQKACAAQMRFDLDPLREAARGYGHLEAWLARAAEWLPHMKDKPRALVERWEEQFGATPALERLRSSAVFHADFAGLWNALSLGQEADLRRAAGKGWESGAVRLMTLHGAKGLEFPAVFVTGVGKGGLPLESAARPADIEEERRLFYVGMTRARDELILTTSGEPSVFLDDLPDSVRRETAGRRREKPMEQISLF
ncbi:UvrD-helicase domain-containing protein [Agathobaculum sp.]|uniref:UvrD-helicase domain-containing protein n=1 Tax=Agathobaculum sp. TaxID=2048138 RepID=UPI002A83648D|nr:UvrD-helicase domain-containing protein [Agathobaculum sp.]MDY3618361.1 UvrD-helicase domain-containing protein [Agathobaculum sp.]